MGRISVDYSALEPLPDAAEVRDAGTAYSAAVEAVQTAIDQAQSDWVPVNTLLTSTSMDLQGFHTAFNPLSQSMGEVVDEHRSIGDASQTLADELEGIRKRLDTLKSTTVPARQSRLDTAISALDEESRDTDSSLTAEAESEMQAIADQIARDWDEDQDAFNNACSSLYPVVPWDFSRFDYGSSSATSAEGLDLFEDASSDSATPEQIEAWYDHLAGLTPQELAALVLVNPGMRTTPPLLPQGPEDVAGWPGGDYGGDWWDSLSEDQRDALIAYVPATVGNTEGIPYGTRDQANRNTLDYVLYAGHLQFPEQATYEQIREALNSAGPGRGDRFLLSFNPHDRPLAAVSVGDVDTADDVSVMVSGMTSGTHNMTGEVSHAQNVYDGLTGNNAVVSWIGYDSPNYATVFSDADATEGAAALAQFLDGIHETRSRTGEPPQVNVMAHSYGTNTAATALTVTEHQAENYIMYGSAGLDPSFAESASDLNVAQNGDGDPQVYTTDAGEDSLSWIGRLGSWFSRLDPNDDDFGAIEFSSDGSGNVPGHPVAGHGQNIGEEDEWGYVEPGSQAYNSIIMILEGTGGEITPMSHEQGTDGDSMIIAPGPDGYLDDPAYGDHGVLI